MTDPTPETLAEHQCETTMACDCGGWTSKVYGLPFRSRHMRSCPKHPNNLDPDGERIRELEAALAAEKQARIKAEKERDEQATDAYTDALRDAEARAEAAEARVTELEGEVRAVVDALADEKAAREEAERMDAVRARWHLEEKARAVKAEQERDGYKRDLEITRTGREQAEASMENVLSRHAALVARINVLADKWIAEDDMTQWGVHTKSRCGHDLRALTEEEQDHGQSE